MHPFLLCRIGIHKRVGFFCHCVRCYKEMHKWKGCKCTECSSKRDEDHDSHKWSGCKCTTCEKVRDEGHDFSRNCKKCKNCGKRRVVEHVWNGCKCTKCEETRDDRYEGHNWDGCICKNCGRHGDLRHEWDKKSGLYCVKCRKMRNLKGKTIVVAAYSLVEPFRSASERDRRFLCKSRSFYSENSYDGVWLVDGTAGTTGSFVVEKVID